MGYSVFMGHHFAQMQDDYATLDEAVAAARLGESRGAQGVFVTDDAGRRVEHALPED